MTLRHALLLAALCLLVVGCVRIRPAPNVASTPTPSVSTPSATLGPATELGVGLTDRAASAASPTPPPRRYTVQAGDTLVAIAERFGVTPEAIIEASQLADPNNLAVGDTLLIPQQVPATTRPAGAPTPTPTPQQRHVVQAGDTLAAIAERFGVSAAEIARANRLADPDRLKVGDTLVIPASARPAQQPAASSAAAQAARAPTPAPQPPRRRHTVQEGDSLWSIAEANGISVDALRAANPGLSERLRVGQELVIP